MPFQWSLIWGSTWVCSNLAYKYTTRVEVANSNKHSSLLRYRINYDCKIFFSTGHRKLFHRRNKNKIEPVIQNLFCSKYHAVIFPFSKYLRQSIENNTYTNLVKWCTTLAPKLLWAVSLETAPPPISSIRFPGQIGVYFVLFKKCFNCK
jgi:hypothetical protein